MKMREIMETASAGSTTAGAMAPANVGMAMIRRTGSGLLTGKYTTEPTPNTPARFKRKQRAGR